MKMHVCATCAALHTASAKGKIELRQIKERSDGRQVFRKQQRMKRAKSDFF